MALDLVASLKVIVAVLTLAGIVGLIGTFFEGRDTGVRAFVLFGICAGAVGLMQIFQLRYAPAILAVAAVVGIFAYRRLAVGRSR